MASRCTREREGVFDAGSSREVSHLPCETVRIDRKNVGVLKVNRSGSVTEEKQQEVNRLGIVDEIAIMRLRQSCNHQQIQNVSSNLLPELCMIRQTRARILLGGVNEGREFGAIADREDRLLNLSALVSVTASSKIFGADVCMATDIQERGYGHSPVTETPSLGCPRWCTT